MIHTHLKLMHKINAEASSQEIPGFDELTAHLELCLSERGAQALTNFSHLQALAANVWGAEESAHFAQVLRNARVKAKASRRTAWQSAQKSALQLPADWRDAILRQVERSQSGRVKGQAIWSASYCRAVIWSLRRWINYCDTYEYPHIPDGSALEQFANWLTDPRHAGKPVSIRTAADYLWRVHGGLAIIKPGAGSAGREFVIRDWEERAKAAGPTTKSGSQLVGASAIYDLGFKIIEAARTQPMRGIHAAKNFRNGLILVIGAALPQRARSLSAIEFDKTLFLKGDDAIHIRIPANMLKLPEAQKTGAPFDLLIHNDRLAESLTEYRQKFRPIFDSGNGMFPSVLARNEVISEGQIGKLTGDMTQAAFGVRIPIHRVRDNVATEAAEVVDGGRLASSVLLRHTNTATTRHYDHSTGLKATQEYGGFLENWRSAPTDLML